QRVQGRYRQALEHVPSKPFGTVPHGVVHCRGQEVEAAPSNANGVYGLLVPAGNVNGVGLELDEASLAHETEVPHQVSEGYIWKACFKFRRRYLEPVGRLDSDQNLSDQLHVSCHWYPATTLTPAR